MTKAEYYRKQHRERQEEPLAISILNLFGFLAVAMIWLALLMVWM